MKTRYVIEVETKNMKPCYNTDDPAEFKPENLKTGEVESAIHDALEKFLKDRIEGDYSEWYMINQEENVVEGWDKLDEYGDIKITVEKEMQCN